MNFIVVDRGNAQTKVGTAGSDGPDIIKNSYVGWLRGQKLLESPLYFAEDACSQRNVLNMSTVYDESIDVETQFLDGLINDYDLTDSGIVMTENHFDPQRRQKLVEHYLGQKQIPSFFIGSSAVFGLLSGGLGSGMSVDFGWKTTRITPIFEGASLSRHTKTINIGSYDSMMMASVVLESNDFLETGIYRPAATDIVESTAIIATNYKKETLNPLGLTYTLPDGSRIDISKERYNFGELYFRPELVDRPRDQSIVTVMEDVIAKSTDTISDLNNKIVLTGGPADIEGMDGRMTKYFKGCTRNFCIGQNRQNGPWIGASMASFLPSFDHFHISIDEYVESGPTIVHRKCLL